jgi:serine/threonine protein kinase
LSNDPGPEPANPGRVEELFGIGCELPPDERKAYLARECAGAPRLHEAVASLLAAHDRAVGEIEPLDAARAAELLAATQSTGAERIIGPYRVVRTLGQGGMGTVFLAERIEGGFEQQVALKLVKRGMDSDAILERFRQERQILARLEHPKIARLLDGGVSDDGRPFFAMEYVDGEPITAYAGRRGLGVDDRLALVRQVCDAVQQAHSSLVVHRDLKPSNILVTTNGEVKLVDFGIAKVVLALDRELLGDRHVYVAYSFDNLATVLAELGQLDETLELFDGAHAILLETRGPASVGTAVNRTGRAGALRLDDDPAAALPLLQEAREVFRDAPDSRPSPGGRHRSRDGSGQRRFASRRGGRAPLPGSPGDAPPRGSGAAPRDGRRRRRPRAAVDPYGPGRGGPRAPWFRESAHL